MTTITQVITALPTAPDPATMTRDEFSAAAAASVLAQKAMTPEINTWAGQANTVAGEVSTNATNAAASAVAAAASAASASAAAGVVEWVSGTTYTVGDTVWSPIDFLTYRRKTAGAGTTDPSADSTNWQLLLAAGAPTWTTLTFADSPFQLVVGGAYAIDSSGGAITLTAPASLSANDVMHFKCLGDDVATNNVTIARNGHSIEGIAQDMTVSKPYLPFDLTYLDATYGLMLT